MHFSYFTEPLEFEAKNIKRGGESVNIPTVVVQSPSRVRLLATPWTTAHQASLPTSWSSPKFMSVESVMPSNHLILCRPPLLLPSVFPMIRVFSNELALSIRWPKHIFNFEQNYFQEIKSLCMVQQAPKELHGDKTF